MPQLEHPCNGPNSRTFPSTTMRFSLLQLQIGVAHACMHEAAAQCRESREGRCQWRPTTKSANARASPTTFTPVRPYTFPRPHRMALHSVRVPCWPFISLFFFSMAAGGRPLRPGAGAYAWGGWLALVHAMQTTEHRHGSRPAVSQQCCRHACRLQNKTMLGYLESSCSDQVCFFR